LVEIHELQAELYVFKTRGIANFGTRCIYIYTLKYVTKAMQ